MLALNTGCDLQRWNKLIVLVEHANKDDLWASSLTAMWWLLSRYTATSWLALQTTIYAASPL